MKINNKKVKEIGKNLYEDVNGYIYIVHNKNYLMLDKQEQKIFQLYRSRLVLAILTGFVCYYYFENLFLLISVSIVLFLVMEICYRKIFISKLVIVKTDKENENRNYSFFGVLVENEYLSLIKRTVLSILICGIFCYNFIDLGMQLTNVLNINNLETMLTTILYILMMVGTLIIGLLNLFAIIHKRRKNK